MVQQQVRRESVPIAPEAGHLPQADWRNQRLVAKSLAGVRVGDMDLDDRDLGDVALTYEAGHVVLGRSQRPDEPR